MQGSSNKMKATVKRAEISKKREPVIVQHWYEKQNISLFLLIAVPVLVYFQALTLGFTMLDDTIFIVEYQYFNKDLANLFHSFDRGLFSPANDFYYRPLFLVDFILESRLFGVSAAGYHFTNLLFHVVCVVLLYYFLMAVGVRQADSLFLSLLFSLHPVLSQAVAWIPGRNDMLLMIFFLSGMLFSFKYTEHPSWYWWLLQSFAFLLALFTKETAVIMPIVALSLLIIVRKASWKIWAPLTVGWIIAMVAWSLVRSHATLLKRSFTAWDLVQTGYDRFPALLQYLGKIFFPFNLTVFPGIDTVPIWWGVLALVVLAGLIFWSKSYFKILTIIGIGWFILFLLPVLIVPASLNDQVFEHRLYIPLVGILLILSQTRLFGSHEIPAQKQDNQQKKGNRQAGKISPTWFIIIKRYFKPALALSVLLMYAIITLTRTGYYKDPVTFWTHAVNGNPSSAYANMMLGLRQTDQTEMKRYLMTAYRLNPEEKMLNYLIGKLELDAGNTDKARFHLIKELKHSSIPDNYFSLAKVYFMKSNLDSAAWCLERVIETDPLNPQANHNLSLLYLQLNRKADALRLVESMKQKGLEIPAEFRDVR